ncbi:MAG: twin-arginine translocation signal domain-containing protein, partial [Acidobacteriaceae bacterium]
MKRREFLRACAAAAAASAISTPGWAIATEATGRDSNPSRRSRQSSLLEMVRPMIGTGWHGHMFPGAVAPFGLVQLSPDTSGMQEPKWNGKWDITGW